MLEIWNRIKFSQKRGMVRNGENPILLQSSVLRNDVLSAFFELSGTLVEGVERLLLSCLFYSKERRKVAASPRVRVRGKISDFFCTHQ
jgi:hypothetical protein